ncbi:MAG: hypothetical protein RL095_1424 [Verrucomicrobiota bacterium]|jgi:hypothetical protein
MYFIIAEKLRGRNGYRPDLPKSSGYCLLADNGWQLHQRSENYHGFGLYRISKYPPEVPQKPSRHLIDGAFSTLLSSALSFPPGWAFAVNHMNKQPKLTIPEFCDELKKVLVRALEDQRKNPSCLIRCRHEEVGYRSVGEFVWVINFNPELKGKEVSWMASDYCVYRDAVEQFDVEPEWLARRFSRAIPPG